MKSLPSLTTLLVATSSGLFGQSSLQIDWSTPLTLAPIVTSDGSALSLSEFSIELGGFANGFVPTSANIDEWVIGVFLMPLRSRMWIARTFL